MSSGISFTSQRAILIERANLNIERSKETLAELDQEIALLEVRISDFDQSVRVIEAKLDKKQKSLDTINERMGTDKAKERDNADAFGLERDVRVISWELAEARKPIEEFTPELKRLQEQRIAIIKDLPKHEAVAKMYACQDRLQQLDLEWMAEHKRMVAHASVAGISPHGLEGYHSSADFQKYKSKYKLNR